MTTHNHLFHNSLLVIFFFVGIFIHTCGSISLRGQEQYKYGVVGKHISSDIKIIIFILKDTQFKSSQTSCNKFYKQSTTWNLSIFIGKEGKRRKMRFYNNFHDIIRVCKTSNFLSTPRKTQKLLHNKNND